MTNPVIENVRRSLGRTGSTPLPARPDIYPARFAGSLDSEIGRFLGELKLLSGEGMQLKPQGIGSSLKALIEGQNIRKATAWNTPFLNRLKIVEQLSALGVEIVAPNADKHEMALCDLGVTGADYALPETGTIVLRSSEEEPRAVSLLPRIHLAILTSKAMRADLHQVFAEAKSSHYLVFITGPSRTSDIELTTTLGVHGPRNLFVWVLDEDQAEG